MTGPLLPPSCVLAEVAGSTVILYQRSGAMLVTDASRPVVPRADRRLSANHPSPRVPVGRST